MPSGGYLIKPAGKSADNEKVYVKAFAYEQIFTLPSDAALSAIQTMTKSPVSNNLNSNPKQCRLSIFRGCQFHSRHLSHCSLISLTPI